MHQWHNVVDADLLKRVLASARPARPRRGDPRALLLARSRAGCACRCSRPRPTTKTRASASKRFAPPASSMRREARRGCARRSLKQPTDYYLDYTLNETMRQLEPLKKQVLEKGAPIASDNPAGRDFLFHSLKTDELLKLQRSVPVLEAILARADASDSDRMLALADLAKARGQNRVITLLDEINAALGTPRETTPAPADSTAKVRTQRRSAAAARRRLPAQ